MGLIREPKGVDLIVGPSVLTDKDRKMISEIIANYKKTGKLPSKIKKQTPRGRRSTTHKSIAASRDGR
ncbi:MAG TPA: hypothetical protein VN958_09155 [Chitinophagaceae bacterium]|nr:hypothetical protein [Chitinophagaceae bacterium]